MVYIRAEKMPLDDERISCKRQNDDLKHKAKEMPPESIVRHKP